MPELKHLYEMTNVERYSFWRNNLLAAQAFWATIEPENVDLSDWRDPDGTEELPVDAGYGVPPTCGTIACFGGWLPWSPYFKALGVTVDPERGWPQIGTGERSEIRDSVAQYLFGE